MESYPGGWIKSDGKENSRISNISNGKERSDKSAASWKIRGKNGELYYKPMTI